MLPSRSTLESWRPDALITSSADVEACGESVRTAVSSIDDACERLPEVRAWSGPAHDAAAEMFGRADVAAGRFADYTSAVAAALRGGAEAIGAARTALLAKADELDAGPLNVTDQWVVLIDPVLASEDQMAELQALATQEQTVVNQLLVAVGHADDATADGVAAAGDRFGFIEPDPPTDVGGLLMPLPQRPPDQVPDPRTVVGIMDQEAIRSADQQQNIREVVDSENSLGEEVTTVIKQDGSKVVTTRLDPFEWTSRMNFYEMEEFDKNGEFIARTSSWHDLGNDYDYTTVQFADGAHLTMSMSPTGYRTAGFTTTDGRHSAVPVELIDNMSVVTTSGMSGLEKHIGRGGSLPMVTAESVDNIGKTMKFGGPALSAATTVFDMVMADTARDKCVALVSGVVGGGGGWGGAELGAAAGAATGPAALYLVPTLAGAFALLGGFGGAELGEFIGEAVCPY